MKKQLLLPFLYKIYNLDIICMKKQLFLPFLYKMKMIRNFCVRKSSVPEPVEPKLFGDLEPEQEPEPKIKLNKHLLQSVWRMLG